MTWRSTGRQKDAKEVKGEQNKTAKAAVYP